MMEQLIKMLHEGGHTLVVSHAGEIRTFDRRGVADLYTLFKETPAFLKDAVAADKVVGKGAAALFLAGGVRQIHADVLSEPALDLLRNSTTEVAYDQLVPHIWNRTHTDWCPVEKCCYPAKTVDECITQIDEFIQQNNQTQKNLSYGNNR